MPDHCVALYERLSTLPRIEHQPFDCSYLSLIIRSYRSIKRWIAGHRRLRDCQESLCISTRAYTFHNALCYGSHIQTCKMTSQRFCCEMTVKANDYYISSNYRSKVRYIPNLAIQRQIVTSTSYYETSSDLSAKKVFLK